MTTGLYEMWLLLHLSKEKWNGNSIFQEINKELKKQISWVFEWNIVPYCGIRNIWWHMMWRHRHRHIWYGRVRIRSLFGVSTFSSWLNTNNALSKQWTTDSVQLSVQWSHTPCPGLHSGLHFNHYHLVMSDTVRHANSVPVPLYSLPWLVPYIVYYTALTIYTGNGENEWTSERFRTRP